MNKLFMTMMMTLSVLFTAEKALADCCKYKSHVKNSVVKGGGTYAFSNTLSQGFNLNVVELDVKSKGNRLVKGSVSISTEKAGPIDPVTGVDEEAKGCIDAIRVFAAHPGFVWVHGFLEGFIVSGTAVVPPNGSIQYFNQQNGEFIGAVSTCGRTNFLSVLENNNQPLPDFYTATEDELITTVGGFSRLLLTNGAKPAKMVIKVPEEDIIIRK